MNLLWHNMAMVRGLEELDDRTIDEWWIAAKVRLARSPVLDYKDEVTANVLAGLSALRIFAIISPEENKQDCTLVLVPEQETTERTALVLALDGLRSVFEENNVGPFWVLRALISSSILRSVEAPLREATAAAQEWGALVAGAGQISADMFE